MTYSFNQNYFNIIDSEEKAYWIGFIWCDGYVCKRIRNGKISEYQIKISLSEKDKDHLYKLKKSLDSSHPIKFYESSKSAYTTLKETRLMLSSKYMGRLLYDEYGLVPNRFDISKLIEKIPKQFEKHFIRGIYDAEGSLSAYYHVIKEEWNPTLKIGLNISTYEELIKYIQNHFIENGLKNKLVKTSKRHRDRDMHCVSLRYSGVKQVLNILEYLYGEATVYLERKYQKYLDVENMVKSKEVSRGEI